MTIPAAGNTGERTAIGEVIAATTTVFTAQCPRPLLHRPPVFGAFVRVFPVGGQTQSATVELADRIEDPFAERPTTMSGLPAGTLEETLYAVVYSAATGSAEPGRRPTAYGLEEDDLRRQQPQIFDLLATEFSALHVGWAHNGRFRAGIPPRPARLHASVFDCSPEEVCAVSDTPELLRALVKTPPDVPADELIVACLRHAYACRNDDYAYLVRAGKQLANLLRDDPDRLTALLARLSP